MEDLSPFKVLTEKLGECNINFVILVNLDALGILTVSCVDCFSVVVFHIVFLQFGSRMALP